jgi:hypothetical protein
MSTATTSPTVSAWNAEVRGRNGALVERVAALAGIAAAVLWVATAVATPKPPNAEAPLGEITAYFSNHRDALLLDGVVAMLTIPLLVLFVAGLRARIARADGTGSGAATAVLAGGVVTIAGLGLQAVVFAALSQRIAALGSGDVVRAVYDLNWLTYALVGAAAGAFMVAAAAAGLVTGALPRWIAGLAGALGTLSLIGACATVWSDTSPLGVLGFAGARVGLFVWIVIVAAVMLRPRAADVAAAAYGQRLAGAPTTT